MLKAVKIKKYLSPKLFSTSLLSGSLVLYLPALAYAESKDCQNTETSAALKKCLESNRLIDILQTIVNFLSISIGIVVVAMIIVGGIQYITAGSNPSAVAAAKSKIINALIALIAFIFTFAFLQWLVPGGIF